MARSMGLTDLLEPTCGPLLVVGGAEDKTGACVILRELVRLAGGATSRIAVLTTASEFPREVGATYVRVLTRLGAGHVEPVHVELREQAECPETLRRVESATAAFFTGGIQARIADLVLGTDLHDILYRRWRAGGLAVGGTSAGAAAMSELMIVGSPGPVNVRPDGVIMGSGLGFTPQVIVDQHFSERRRLGRLVRAVARHPDRLGLGIDEDTAILVHGDTFGVIGRGTVTLVDSRASRRSTTWMPLRADDTNVVRGSKVDVLFPGQRAKLGASPSAEPSRSLQPLSEAQPR